MNQGTGAPLLAVRDLRTWFDDRGRVVKAVDGIDFDLHRGETLGIVGESGSGKSVTSLSIMGLVPTPGRIVSGSVRFEGRSLLDLSPAELRTIRGRRIAMMFQDPMSALHPLMRIAAQLTETTRLHLRHTRPEARQHAIGMLASVAVPDAAARVDDYPHQFSGGMRQRVVMAMALSCQPDLLIADEPTTALDATIQAQVLALMGRMTRAAGTSVILITHDLGVVAGVTDRVLVMYAGRIVERGATRALFASPAHPYTRGLLQSVPNPVMTSGGRLSQIPGAPPDLSALPPGCAFAPRCAWAQPVCHDQAPPRVALNDGHEACCHFALDVYRSALSTGISTDVNAPSITVRLPGSVVRRGADGIDAGPPRPLVEVRDLTVQFSRRHRSVIGRMTGASAPARVLTAVDGVSLDIFPGETLGLVGESGCGKTTLGRAILRLVEPARGRVRFGDVEVTRLATTALRRQRRHMQMIFQDPYASLDPRMTVSRIIGEPIASFGLADRAAVPARVRALMDTVGLSARVTHRYPHELSGGQQQRVGIARALAAEPSFIVADEPLSALDVSIQAQILNLIADLQRQRALAFLFISHDLRAVRHVSDRVAVMYLGAIVEIGAATRVTDRPLMPYTKALMSAVRVPDPVHEAARPRLVLEGDTAAAAPSGCRFRTRCPYVVPACRSVAPALVEIEPGHFAACHRINPTQPDIGLV